MRGLTITEKLHLIANATQLYLNPELVAVAQEYEDAHPEKQTLNKLALKEMLDSDRGPTAEQVVYFCGLSDLQHQSHDKGSVNELIGQL